MTQNERTSRRERSWKHINSALDCLSMAVEEFISAEFCDYGGEYFILLTVEEVQRWVHRLDQRNRTILDLYFSHNKTPDYDEIRQAEAVLAYLEKERQS